MTTSFVPVRIPAEDEALRAPVRRFLAEALQGMPPALRARSWMGFDADFSRALARQGWLGLTLPTRYGGAGRSAFARFVLSEELLAAGAPVSAHWIADRQTAPLILRYGTQAQRERFLPAIARGELFVAIGMSEPDTGSDLAGVRTRALRTDTGWVLRGRKIWTTNAHRSQFMCALVRTSGTPEDRHKGLSQVLVDLSLPGITVRPLLDITGDRHFCEVLFDDVALPADALVGAEGAGWEQVTAELAFERSGPERLLSSMVLVDTWLAHLRTQPAVDDAALAVLGRMASSTAVLRAMSLSIAAQLQRGEQPALAASFVKDLGTEFEQAVPGWVAQALDHDGAVAPPALLQTVAYLTQIEPSFSLRGGTRQILRGIIARGLGMR
ncbi:acyl-CoA dehydrogenase family protein [Pseudorhodoferax soli]|uniref:acyl-CoA dehydrogenase family protein n=1 Tax=Pseudorhodoferax soli TaxID=545864 RepID=UPI000DF2DACE|nr:acyl-CoA dehydrogenase family protein [Pseudorhodoferax soli]